MAVSTQTSSSVPTGTWHLDPVHSSVGFEVDYMVGTFRGQFRDVQATLVSGEDAQSLEGAATVASVDVKDENLALHLQSPEFFDAERHPKLRFASTDLRADGERLAVAGEIEIKGVTRPVELTGTITEPIVDPYGKERLGLRLEAAVDRTAFGLNWNAPLPTGEPALANEVRLVAELPFVKEA
jgi:polyisoprenoid-binding protein YceI